MASVLIGYLADSVFLDHGTRSVCCGCCRGGVKWPRCSGSGERGGEVADRRRVRTGGEGETDARRGFDDAGTGLQQPQGCELGDRQCVRFWDGVAQREDQPVGGSMEDQSHLVCERRAAAGAVRRELALVPLDQVLGLAADAGEDFADMLGRTGFEAGDDETDVEAAGRGVDITPPSEVIRPPSKAAVTFLRATAGNANGSTVSSIMADVAGPDVVEGSASATKPYATSIAYATSTSPFPQPS